MMTNMRALGGDPEASDVTQAGTGISFSFSWSAACFRFGLVQNFFHQLHALQKFDPE